MNTIPNDERRSSYIFLVKWISIAAVTGIMGSCLLQGFRTLVDIGQSILSSVPIPLPVWGGIAAIIVGGIVYRIEPDAAGEGMPSYLECLNRCDGDFPIRPTAWKLPGALLTLASFGSGGLAGPIGRVNAGLASFIARKLPGKLLTPEDMRTASICGMSAVIGALFHSPVGGGIFAVEIIQKANMRYRDLFPSIMCSSAAVWLSKAMGWEPLFSVGAVAGPIPAKTLGLVIALAFALGIIGGLYTRFYAIVVRVFRRDQGRVVIKVLIGTLVASFVAWIVNPELMGTASTVIKAIIADSQSAIYGNIPRGVPIEIAAICILLVRGFASCVTIGSGMSAGLMGPSAMIGMIVAYAVSHIVNTPAASTEFFAILSAGFAGMLASTMNVPIAAAVMTIEVFGLSFSLPAGVAAIIGFQVNRHRTLYDFALAGSGYHGKGTNV